MNRRSVEIELKKIASYLCQLLKSRLQWSFTASYPEQLHAVLQNKRKPLLFHTFCSSARCARVENQASELILLVCHT